jgi:cell division protein FtsN
LLKTNKKQTMSLERPQLKGLLLVLALILIVVVIAAVVASRKAPEISPTVNTQQKTKQSQITPPTQTNGSAEGVSQETPPSDSQDMTAITEEADRIIKEHAIDEEASWKALEEQAKNQEALMKEAIEKTQQDE